MAVLPHRILVPAGAVHGRLARRRKSSTLFYGMVATVQGVVDVQQLFHEV